MESKQQPGLYCIGEVVDVTGHLGGFNFQWAWSSRARCRTGCVAVGRPGPTALQQANCELGLALTPRFANNAAAIFVLACFSYPFVSRTFFIKSFTTVRLFVTAPG